MNTAICFSFIAKSDIPRAATRAKRRHRTTSTARSRLTTCSNSNSCTSLVGKNGSVRRSQLRPTWIMIKPITSSKLISVAGTQSCCCTGKAETRCRSCRWRAHLGEDLALWTPHMAEATCAHSPTGPIRFWSHNLQIYLHRLPSSSLSVPTLAPGETIALALVTATGIKTTTKIRIFWGNVNEDNPTSWKSQHLPLIGGEQFTKAKGSHLNSSLLHKLF